jgi:hypothetical protein
MVSQQREAVFALCSSLVFTVLVLLLRGLFGAHEVEALLVALVAFIVAQWAGRRIVGLRADTLDERDLAFRNLAAHVGTLVFGVAVVAGVAVLWLVHRETLLVPVAQVALLAFLSYTAMYVAWSVAVLVLYRRGS